MQFFSKKQVCLLRGKAEAIDYIRVLTAACPRCPACGQQAASKVARSFCVKLSIPYLQSMINQFSAQSADCGKFLGKNRKSSYTKAFAAAKFCNC